MKIREFIKGKRNMVTIVSVAVSGVLLLCAFTANGAAQDEAETLYRESAVERGDIIVGVTENVVATLKSHSLSFDVNAEIEEVFVKAGQSVREGDPIASISSETLMEEISSLNVDYRKAALELSEAQLARQKGELEAESTRDTTLNKSDSADDTYDMTIRKLELAVTQAKQEVAEIEREISTYNLILGYSFDSDDDYTSSASYDPQYDKNFETDDEVISARRSAYNRLAAAEGDLEQAEYNLSTQTSEAGLTRDKSLSSAELADTIYEMELKSLKNGVASKQLALENIQEQIDKYTAYLEETVITAPCDGIVTSVSCDAGDSVQAGAAVAAISDSANVFVYLSVTQDDITGVTLGQTASVALDAFEELSFDGTVDSITTTPARSASGSASYNVTIRLEGDTAQVYEGMTGSATLITRQQKDVLYVTSRTVYQKDGASHVKVRNDDGTISEVAVTTGFSDGRNVEITEGLTEGQTVLIESQVSSQR